MTERATLACPDCQYAEICGPTAMLDWLRRARAIRLDVEHEPELVAELFRATAAKFRCRQCGSTGLVVRPAAAEDDETWGMARKCAACGQAISRERLEALPSATLCVKCQSQDDQGRAADDLEYCPRCGSVMAMRQSRTPGVTRYVMACPKCGR